MAAGGEQGNDSDGGVAADLYAVLGLKKECSAADLRSAYKKLALQWHPDRCFASGSSKTVEEAKTKFQAIQEAYSVLSDTNKRFLYDVGVYDDDDDASAAAADGMGEFMCEMAAMMSQANRNPCESGSETFEQLQELFVEMFQADMGAGGGGGGETTATASWRVQGGGDGGDRRSTSSATCFSSTSSDSTAPSFYGSCRAAAAAGSLKRDSADMCSGKAKGVAADTDGAGGHGPGSAFCFGTNDRNSSSTSAAKGRAAAGKRRSGGKPKESSRHDGPSPQSGETPATE